jgi:hypothetical protein
MNEANDLFPFSPFKKIINCKKKEYVMKKLLTIFATVVLLLGMTMSAQAELVTITFDEPGITSGPTTSRFDGTPIDTEYSGSPWGITWVDIVPTSPISTGQWVTQPSEFNGFWTDSDQMLYYAPTTSGGTSPFTAQILLTVPADFLSFEYRRPNNAGTFDVLLYSGSTLVYDDPGLSWDPIDDKDWKTFTYNGGQPFDKVSIWGSDKSLTDNYTFNTVPIPSAFWLMGSGLFFMIRRRKN